MYLPQQLPHPRKVAGQKKRQQQSNGFDRLHRAEVDLGAARARSAPEHEEKQRQAEGAHQRQVAQTEDRCPAKLHERAADGGGEADEHSLHVADEQRRVAQRIRARQERREPQRRQEQGGAEQKLVAAAASETPDQARSGESGEEEGRPAEHEGAELRFGAHREPRLHQRQLGRREHRHVGRRIGTALRRAFSGFSKPLGVLDDTRRPLDRGRRYLGTQNRAHVGQDLAGLT